MIEQFIQGRTSVFVDASNIYHSENYLQFRIDFRKLKKYFSDRLKLIRIYFYTARIQGLERQSRFLSRLRMNGYIVREKEVKQIRDRETHELIRKGNLDVELVIDALDTLHEYENCVLLSGDSDFAPLLAYLKNKGKRVVVMSTKVRVSRELLEEAKYIDLRKIKNEIEFLPHKEYPLSQKV